MNLVFKNLEGVIVLVLYKDEYWELDLCKRKLFLIIVEDFWLFFDFLLIFWLCVLNLLICFEMEELFFVWIEIKFLDK